MKTVTMMRDYSYRPFKRKPVIVQYLGGATYDRVPEAAVRSIVGAGAGYVVEPQATNE
ncbi:hypothetical protein [Rhodopseudomonas telluris]|uniref:Uncharacterized protein n=1 Tax=Rhodopseudomonas telluris TaxID=644215 RepID=A0ABV6EZL3_9BRAD